MIPAPGFRHNERRDGFEMKKFLHWMLVVMVMAIVPAGGQTAPAGVDPFVPLAFLEGTWAAKATGADGVTVNGSYTFVPELKGAVLARHSTTDPRCRGPVTFDCAHTDLLYVFQDVPGQPLQAIYFDSEGHTLHYTVSTPSPTVAEFLTEASQTGPQFRLVYERKGDVLAGKFQLRPPGGGEWRSYLEWSGARVTTAK